MNKKLVGILICMLLILTALQTFGSITKNITLNNPPNKPTKPSGPTSGDKGQNYRYESYFSDPEGDSMEILFDWGDGTDTGWIGVISSGVTVGNFHTWDEDGIYQVRTRARDLPAYEESEWSDSLSVIIGEVPIQTLDVSGMIGYVISHEHEFNYVKYLVIATQKSVIIYDPYSRFSHEIFTPYGTSIKNTKGMLTAESNWDWFTVLVIYTTEHVYKWDPVTCSNYKATEIKDPSGGPIEETRGLFYEFVSNGISSLVIWTADHFYIYSPIETKEIYTPDKHPIKDTIGITYVPGPPRVSSLFIWTTDHLYFYKYNPDYKAIEIRDPNAHSIKDGEVIVFKTFVLPLVRQAFVIGLEDHVFVFDPTGIFETFEIKNPSGQPIKNVRGMLSAHSNWDWFNTLVIYTTDHVYLYDIITCIENKAHEIFTPAGDSIKNTQGLLYEFVPNGISTLVIWTAKNLYRYSPIFWNHMAREIFDPDGKSVVGVQGAVVLNWNKWFHELKFWNENGVFVWNPWTDQTREIEPEPLIRTVKNSNNETSKTDSIINTQGIYYLPEPLGFVTIWTPDHVYWYDPVHDEGYNPDYKAYEISNPQGSSIKNTLGVIFAPELLTEPDPLTLIVIWTAEHVYTFCPDEFETTEIFDPYGIPISVFASESASHVIAMSTNNNCNNITCGVGVVGESAVPVRFSQETDASAYIPIFSTPSSLTTITAMGELFSLIIGPEPVSNFVSQDRIVVFTSSLGNHPPNKPTRPSGPESGKVGESLRYESYFSDIDGDSLEVFFDWGDGTNTGWIGVVASGSIIGEYHTYISEGDYQIRTKARDIVTYTESEWSSPLVITMPKNKAIDISLFLQKFFQHFPFFKKILNQII